MKKFVMALSILAMGGSALFGVLNKKDLAKELEDLSIAQTNLTETNTELSATEDKLATAQDTEKQRENDRDEVSAKVSETNQSLTRVKALVEGTQADIKDAETEREEINMAIRKAFPDGVIKSADDVRKQKQMLQDALTEKQNSKAEREAELTASVAELAKQQKRVQEGEAQQIKRAQLIALNGLEATVIAVNRDWGFVMVNAGKNYGVTAESSLLVKRGNERVARLRIVSLEPDMVVCDIIPESLTAGTKIVPGDKVIFEDTK